ncbi:6,7-dimethyl-8-ribityllumazine synthase, partial [Gemmatimonas aurantiaca]|nr:6,7-dimethyl-8-ribityllumazine synthase [Gemmatimonas aurantiaca]
ERNGANDTAEQPAKLDGVGLKFGIVTSEFNEKISAKLRLAAHRELIASGVAEEHILERTVPGAYELPLLAQVMLENTDIDAVICLGSVIRGETSHYDYICDAIASSFQRISLRLHKPVISGVLTTENLEQALARSGGDKGNRGIDAARAALAMCHRLSEFNAVEKILRERV